MIHAVRTIRHPPADRPPDALFTVGPGLLVPEEHRDRQLWTVHFTALGDPNVLLMTSSETGALHVGRSFFMSNFVGKVYATEADAWLAGWWEAVDRAVVATRRAESGYRENLA